MLKLLMIAVVIMLGLIELFSFVTFKLLFWHLPIS